MHRGRALLTLLAATTWLGCAPSAEGSPAAIVAPASAVTIDEVVTTPPPGGDGPDVVRLALETDEGRRPIGGEALGGAPFLDGALVLRPDRTLELVRSVTRRSVLDREVLFTPVVSSDGEHAAWAAEHGLEQVLVVIGREGERSEAAQGLISIGAVVLDPSTHGPSRRVAFVGARNGGIAGLWVSHVDGHGLRCLTNCTLRAGQPLQAGTGPDAWQPLPSEPLRFDGDTLVVETEGVTQRLSLEEAR